MFNIVNKQGQKWNGNGFGSEAPAKVYKTLGSAYPVEYRLNRKQPEQQVAVKPIS